MDLVMTQKKKAVVLLSGGLDSGTVLSIVSNSDYECYCLSFRYGQRHSIELEKAAQIAKYCGAKQHRIIEIDIAQLGGSSLTDRSMEVPKSRGNLDEVNEIPNTYVPVRNLIFLSYAVAWAEVLDCKDIFIGVNCYDYSGYPDCRPEFIESFQRCANLASANAVTGKGEIAIHAPIIKMTKAEIIKKGSELGFDYALTHSCYDPINAKPCGKCDSCQLRLKGFREAGLIDPVEYAD